MRKLIALVALAAALVLPTAGSTLGALVNGPLPAAGFIYSSVTDNSVSIAGAGVTLADIASLETYVDKLSAIANRTSAQRIALARYQARLVDYKARYAAAIDLRAGTSVNVKTTYSRVPPSQTYESGWHYHNGPVILTVTVGTLTLYDGKCGTEDISAGHSYIETPRRVTNAKVLPARNPGVADVEWLTTRLYPDGDIDPVPVPAPCAP